MTTTLADALALDTEDALFEGLMADMDASGVNAVGFGPYSVNVALPKLNARSLAKWQSFRAALAQSNFLDTAANADFAYLVRLAKGFFALDWIRATQAGWTMRLTGTTTGGPYTIAPRDLVVSTADNITFTNQEGGTLLAGAGHTLDLAFTADKPGVAGNVAPGLLSGFKKGGIAGATITALTLLPAARDDETAAELIRRCKGRWGTLGAGWTLAAFDFWIPRASSLTTRWRVKDWNPGPFAGSVGILLANASGPSSGGEVAAVLDGLGARAVKSLGSGVLTVDPATAHHLAVASTLITNGTNPNAAALGATALLYLAAHADLGPLTVRASLLSAILMGGAFPELGIPGFPGVTSLSGFTTPDTPLGLGEVLTVTPTIAQV